MPQEPVRAYKVLVVEDEGLIAHDIANRLEAMGHEVIGPVSTAEEAIEQAPSADIVLMDIRIDGQRDGIEAAMEIRARHHLPVIFLTAHADRATLERAKQAGPFGYIVKPLGPASLQTGIEMAIAKHRVDRLLEERETWLRAAIGCIPDGAVVTDPHGRVLLMNRAAERLTGWTLAEAEGQSVGKVLHLTELDSGDDVDPLPLALLRDSPVEFDRHCRLTARDGRELEVEGAVAPVRVSNPVHVSNEVQGPEGLLGAVMTFRDASARRWEERQLRQAQRLEAAGRLAASTAGEYSNLVILIRNHTEQLLRQFSEYSAVRPMLEEIFQAASAADQITRRLGAFGTRQVGQPEILSVNGILRRLTPLLESAAGDRIRVAIRPSPGAGRVKADAAQLEFALMNLVTHACSAIMERSTIAEQGKEGGQILIETACVDLPYAGRTAQYAMLALTYSAVEPDIERLFDPAFVGDAGLALAVVHSVVAEYGGYLSARSGPQGGSRVEMLLPRVSDQVLLPAAAPGSSAVTVMLVEANDAVRAELHNFFEAAGCNLLEACDAREAVALGEVHQGTLDVLVVEAAQAGSIFENLRGVHPALEVLRIVDETERDCRELRRPFTEQSLLARISLLAASHKTQTVTSSS
jgi:two-component system cell cycle sensor histidine kinase/response regulator CckA